MKRRIKHFVHQGISKALFHSGIAGSKLQKGKDHHLVLAYHRIVNPEEEDLSLFDPEITVTTDEFRRHIEFLRKNFKIVSLSEILHCAFSKKYQAARPMCAITFDDGLVGVYRHLYPLLRQRGLPAAVFVATGYVGTEKTFWTDLVYRAAVLLSKKQDRLKSELNRLEREGLKISRRHPSPRAIVESMKNLNEPEKAAIFKHFNEILSSLNLVPDRSVMSWEEVKEMHRTGFEIGSHTVEHVLLDAVEIDRQRSEILKSRKDIEKHLGQAPNCFCYPNGKFNQETLELVREAGYQYGFTDNPGKVSSSPDALQINRLCIGRDPYGNIPAFSSFCAGVFPIIS